jgi:hypothetical protein
MLMITQKEELHTTNAVFTKTHSYEGVGKEVGFDGMKSSVERSLEGGQARLSGATNAYISMSAVMRAHASERESHRGAHYPSHLRM